MRTSITLSDELYESAHKSSKNFSAVVTIALQEYLQKQSVDRAKKSFNVWEERDNDSVEIVNEMRENHGRP